MGVTFINPTHTNQPNHVAVKLERNSESNKTRLAK